MRFRKRSLLRSAMGMAPVRLIVGGASRLARPRDGEVTVGMFHRILSAARFEEQLDALLAGGTAVTGAQVLDATCGGAPLPRGAVWVTFDDAYGDVLERGLPALEQRGIRPTHFVPTAYVGQDPASYWWDRLEDAFDRTTRTAPVRVVAGGEEHLFPMGSRDRRGASLRRARSLVKAVPGAEVDGLVRGLLGELEVEPAPACRVMDWDELVGLVSRGHEVCGHTHTHPMLDRVSPDEARAEIARGFDELRRRLGEAPPILAYPSGQYNGAVIDAARAAGVELAVTTQVGIHRLGNGHPLEIPRVPVGPHADGAVVRLRMLQARLGRRGQ